MKQVAMDRIQNTMLPDVQARVWAEGKRLLPELRELAEAQAKDAWEDIAVVLNRELKALQEYAKTKLRMQLEQALEDFAKQELGKAYPEITDVEKLETVLRNLEQAAADAAQSVFLGRLEEPLTELDKIGETLDQFPPPYPYLEDRELVERFGQVFYEVVRRKVEKIATVE